MIDPYEPLFEPADAINVAQDFDGLSHLREQLEEALTLADSLVPGFATRFASVVVPISASSGWHSATDETCPGVVYLSPAESALGLLEGLVHEEAHVLLNTAEEHLGLGLPESDATVEVPWREDRRPLEAAVHGVAAFSRVEQVRRRAGSPSTAPTGWADVARTLANQPEVDDDLKAWLSSIDVDEPAPAARSESGRAVAASTAGRWAVFDQFHESHVAALLNVAETAGWSRSTTEWFEQWSFELTDDAMATAVESELKRLLATVAGEELRATSHRLLLLGPGDRIERHTDADSSDTYRSVVMLTPGWTYGDGGELEIAAGTPPGAGISIAPESGTVAVFETTPDLWHEVRPVNRRPRLSLTTSWESI